MFLLFSFQTRSICILLFSNSRSWQPPGECLVSPCKWSVLESCSGYLYSSSGSQNFISSCVSPFQTSVSIWGRDGNLFYDLRLFVNQDLENCNGCTASDTRLEKANDPAPSHNGLRVFKTFNFEKRFQLYICISKTFLLTYSTEIVVNTAAVKARAKTTSAETHRQARAHRDGPLYWTWSLAVAGSCNADIAVSDDTESSQIHPWNLLSQLRDVIRCEDPCSGECKRCSSILFTADVYLQSSKEQERLIRSSTRRNRAYNKGKKA